MTRRLLQIIRVAIRYRLDAILTDPTLLGDGAATRPHWLIRWILWLWPGSWVPIADTAHARRLRLALEALGPVFVKLGQMLSTRRDLLPDDYADELAKLQADVPPFPGAEARALVQEALGDAFAEQIAYFVETPVASASIAQVHRATLVDGSDVVVKVVRPDILEVMHADLAVLARLANWADRQSAFARRMHLPEVVRDHARTLLQEVDLRIEGANTQQLRDNFTDSHLLYVPKVRHDLTRANVLVVERIKGVPINDIASLKAHNVDLAELAKRGLEVFFTQVFEHNYFHGDMHPGNIFVDFRDPLSPRYIALDCATMGQLDERIQEYLARNLWAFFNRDYRQVARLHLDSGWVPIDTDEAEFERVIQAVCDPIFAKPLDQINFGNFLVVLFRTASRFRMEIQPELVLLQKTLLYVEGIGRELYPSLDLWQTGKPFMARWMRNRVGPLASLRKFAERAPELIEQLPRLPDLIIDTGRTLRQLELSLRQQQAATSKLAEAIGPGARARWVQALAGASLLLGALVLLLEPAWFSRLEEHSPLLGLLAAALGGVLLARR